MDHTRRLVAVAGLAAMLTGTLAAPALATPDDYTVEMVTIDRAGNDFYWRAACDAYSPPVEPIAPNVTVLAVPGRVYDQVDTSTGWIRAKLADGRTFCAQEGALIEKRPTPPLESLTRVALLPALSADSDGVAGGTLDGLIEAVDPNAVLLQHPDGRAKELMEVQAGTVVATDGALVQGEGNGIGDIVKGLADENNVSQFVYVRTLPGQGYAEASGWMYATRLTFLPDAATLIAEATGSVTPAKNIPAYPLPTVDVVVTGGRDQKADPVSVLPAGKPVATGSAIGKFTPVVVDGEVLWVVTRDLMAPAKASADPNDPDGAAWLDDLRDKANDAKDKAGEVIEDAKDKAADTTADAKEHVKSMRGPKDYLIAAGIGLLGIAPLAFIPGIKRRIRIAAVWTAPCLLAAATFAGLIPTWFWWVAGGLLVAGGLVLVAVRTQRRIKAVGVPDEPGGEPQPLEALPPVPAPSALPQEANRLDHLL